MFGAILTVGVTALVAYVLWRAASVPQLSRRLSRRGFVLLGAGLVVFLFLASAVGHRATGRAAAALDWAGMNLLACLFLVAVALFAVDLATAFGLLFRSWAGALRGWALVAGALLSAIAFVQGHRAPEVASYEVTLPSLPRELDGRVVVALSDTHVGARLDEAWFAEQIATVQALRPDLVLLLGDIVEGHRAAPSDLPALRALDAPLGRWFVEGNHEAHRGGGEGSALLERAGVRRLSNEWALAAPGLVLAGVDDLTHQRRLGLPGDPLGLALADRPAAATILLSHTPWQAERAARAGVELMLSGHTHGGQIWPFGLLTRRTYPLLAGRYDVDGMPVIVSRGSGTWGPRMRLWKRGEILKVTLRAAR